MKVTATVVCPVCGQLVLPPTRGVCYSHPDGLGRPCPFSGQPFGALVQTHVEVFEV